MSASSPADRRARNLALPLALMCALASLAFFAAPMSHRALFLALPAAVTALVLAGLAQRESPRSAWAAGTLLIAVLVLGVEIASIVLARM